MSAAFYSARLFAKSCFVILTSRTMHHIFITHSFTTYLVGRLISHHLKLAHTKQTLLCYRKFQPNSEDFDISIFPTKDLLEEHFPLALNVYRCRSHLEKHDYFISSLTGGQHFSLYIYGTRQWIVQAAMTHPMCKKVSLMEEGLGSYSSKERQAKYYKPNLGIYQTILLRACYGRRINPLGYIEFEGDRYCLSDAAFPGQQKTVLNYPEIQNAVTRPQAVAIPDLANILVHDAIVDFGELTMGTYLHSILFSIRQANAIEIFQKFHPGQSATNRVTITEFLLNNGLHVTTLPDSAPLEHYVFNDRGYSFMGYCSSILVYAYLHKLRVYTKCNNLLDLFKLS